MTNEDELFARVIAQQRQITTLHTVLTRVQVDYGSQLGEDVSAEIAAALDMSEPAGRAEFDAAVAAAVELRILAIREEQEAAVVAGK